MTIVETGYIEHAAKLLERYQLLMEKSGYDHLVIPAGNPIRKYLDDMDYPFKVNPHFKALVPLIKNPHCQIILPQSGKPTLLYYQPVDFWHTVPADPSGAYTKIFDVKIISKPQDALAKMPKSRRTALLGEKQGILEAVDVSAQNPETLIMPLYWNRAYKSAYEIECIYQANVKAARAHKAAEEAFYQQRSELGINTAYLRAAGGLDKDMPYGNIVALNESAAILHYTDCKVDAPAIHNTLLIDAGCDVNGYASDITRTYSFAKNDEFAAMIEAMDRMHLGLLDDIKIGGSYVGMHIKAHYQIAEILKQFEFISCTPEELVETGASSAFFPHGLGHQLGLQVHDVGGHQTNEDGGITLPPEQHPFLRNTRTIEESQVFTVEPGLYFIDSLLGDVKELPVSKSINWSKIELFKPYGGIRIEDDVLVTKDGHRNLSREAFAAL